MKKDLSLILASLHSKVEKLTILDQKNIEELEKLRQENEQIRKQLKDAQGRAVELEEKNKVIKLAQGLSKNDASRNELKSKINELVREIDKCIALTNN